MSDGYRESPARPTVPTWVLIIINIPSPHTSGRILTPTSPFFPLNTPLSRSRRLFLQPGRQFGRKRGEGAVPALYCHRLSLTGSRRAGLAPPPCCAAVSTSFLSCHHSIPKWQRFFGSQLFGEMILQPPTAWVNLFGSGKRSRPARSGRRWPGAEPDPLLLLRRNLTLGRKCRISVSNPQITQHHGRIAESRNIKTGFIHISSICYLLEL